VGMWHDKTGLKGSGGLKGGNKKERRIDCKVSQEEEVRKK